ncbi:Ribosomal protein L16 Arg81 hydroxylase, contains JmjC domain [Cruoricaptor ignavus]|uniref:Ribosomal protein L16 Arg81 hydroxylase, contains JmjC domain n=1 Tax=Cruoricaptor ignavus TaxID=1118202 RepID=A0A1M6D7A9_9FLAO|nr:cupin domain-containing protein [Cruoricaptor ignavus]SHI69021.1 Ribosomal protein L16 Arg81 hydroxylase, contains JmjC domain [Cruoricaptor ignavus]
MENPFFSKIVAPLSVEEFFEKYHEKDMLHIQRNDEQYYNNILTSQEISDYLERQDIFYPSVRIVKNGSELPNSQYTKSQIPIGFHKKDGLIDTEKAFALFNAGSTLVIQAGQRYFDHLSKCCLDLSNKFGSPVQANLYITPNKSVGFNPHWDTHDVFVLQIAGTKTWKLYGFENELPTVNQKSKLKNYQKEPLKTLQVKPGDFLYVPRGFVHDAMADDGISAHITIGILSFTWMRFFSELLPQLENFREFREAVPFWKEDLTPIIAEKLDLFKQKAAELDTQKVVRKLNSAQKRIQPQPFNNYFESLLNIEKISESTVFALNEGIIISRKENADGISLSFMGKSISLPLPMKDFIDGIFEKKIFTVKDFESTRPENALSAAKILLKEGVISIKEI